MKNDKKQVEFIHQQWAIHRLKPYKNNARTHSESQINQVASSILKFGFRKPIEVNADGTIIAGHCRLLAAKKLKLKTVPVMVSGDLNEHDEKAYRIADNQIALNAGWANDILAEEIEDLDLAEYEIELLGFSDEQLIALTKNMETVQEEPAANQREVSNYVKLTFTVTRDQADEIQAAIERQKEIFTEDDPESYNRDGTALSNICETFLTYNT